jgi:hypothetical protein
MIKKKDMVECSVRMVIVILGFGEMENTRVKEHF